MQNLEQLRAKHALAFWQSAREKAERIATAEQRGDPTEAARLRRELETEYGGASGGDVVSKLPSLIISNGLLATLAFAKSKGSGMERLMLELIRFLPLPLLRAMPAPDRPRVGDSPLDPGIRKLSEENSMILQRATTEALAYLGYLKRFAP